MDKGGDGSKDLVVTGDAPHHIASAGGPEYLPQYIVATVGARLSALPPQAVPDGAMLTVSTAALPPPVAADGSGPAIAVLPAASVDAAAAQVAAINAAAAGDDGAGGESACLTLLAWVLLAAGSQCSRQSITNLPRLSRTPPRHFHMRLHLSLMHL
jgi:hypothetical protein